MAKPDEDKVNADRPHPTEQQMDYDVMEANVTTRSQGMVKEDSIILPNIKRL